MFVSTESLGAIQDYNFFNDKELPMGNKSERLVSQFLELSVNPTGDSAYKQFSTMTEEKTFVTENENRSNVTVVSNLDQLSNQLELTGAKFIKIYLKKEKVTTSCRLNGRTFGSSGLTANKSLANLINQVKSYEQVIHQKQVK